jgi:NADP-dependent aldehyde dehydrogenase
MFSSELSNCGDEMELHGRSILGSLQGTTGDQRFRATNPSTGELIEPEFYSASASEVDQAVTLAHQAFSSYSRISGKNKAAFLRKIAGNIEGNAAQIIERAGLESGLPKARLQGETTRTCVQLRLFAEVIEEGSWVMARWDRPDPNRKPVPKPDLRSMLRPLGPIAIFGASNFPLAFSVAGGDTASALAAGNPVVVKTHPAHPGTSELVGHAVREAVRECDLPEGVFSLLFDSGHDVATALVKHPLIKAVGFTGSRVGGKALLAIANARPEPIPVFAEMSSANPFFILPGALQERGDALAEGLYSSITAGSGQFCTKPGMVFLPSGEAASGFTEKLRQSINVSGPFQMLTDGIRSSYGSGISARKGKQNLKLVGEQSVAGASGFCVGGSIFATDVQSFLKDPSLAEEIFGPSTVLIEHSTREEILEVARGLEGHLTATIHGTEKDLREFADVVAVLEQKVGRLIFNGFPTGLEVSHAVVHGGPFPATSDGRSTSVGSQAIFRFCRPVCYQGFPDSMLPDELRNDNPLGIWRMADGEMTRERTANHALQFTSQN